MSSIVSDPIISANKNLLINKRDCRSNHISFGCVRIQEGVMISIGHTRPNPKEYMVVRNYPLILFWFPVSSFRFLISGFLFLVSRFRFLVSGFSFPVFHFRFLVSDFQFTVFCFFESLYILASVNILLVGTCLFQQQHLRYLLAILCWW